MFEHLFFSNIIFFPKKTKKLNGCSKCPETITIGSVCERRYVYTLENRKSSYEVPSYVQITDFEGHFWGFP